MYDSCSGIYIILEANNVIGLIYNFTVWPRIDFPNYQIEILACFHNQYANEENDSIYLFIFAYGRQD